MLKSDLYDYQQDMTGRDAAWKIGYRQGTSAWSRELIGAAVGYFIGRDRSALGHIATLVFVWLVGAYVFHHLLAFALLAGGYWLIRKDRPIRVAKYVRWHVRHCWRHLTEEKAF